MSHKVVGGESKMKKIYLLSILILFLTACNSIPTYQNPAEVAYSIEGEIENQSEVKAAVQVIEDNLDYATKEDMEGYLSTIVATGREETQKELAPVFESYDLEHTVLSVEVLEQEENRLLIRAEQQTVMLDAIQGAEPYRSHIAEANHELIKEDGNWKIKETIMTDTKFIN